MLRDELDLLYDVRYFTLEVTTSVIPWDTSLAAEGSHQDL
jgi:hypothetical protein